MPRAAQRVYTPASLELWFQRLGSPWEDRFAADELALGRQLYRSGEVRSLELTADSVIIHTKRGKQDVYAMVDFDPTGLEFRSSVTDRVEGRGLAAAGLYEVEELIADEVSVQVAATPVLGERGGPRPASPAPATPAATQGHGPSAKSASPERPAAPQGRPMRLRFSACPQGLRMEAFWGAGKGAEPVFATRKVPAQDRESLIRLTTRLRRHEFEFREPQRDYLMRETSRISAFVRTELPRWKGLFQVDIEPQVSLLGKGLQEAVVEVRTSELRDRFDFEMRFRLGDDWLSAEESASLLRHGGQAVLLPERGLVRLPADQAALVDEWRAFCDDGLRGSLPSYMLLALSSQDHIPVELVDAVKRWRESFAHHLDPAAPLPGLLRPYQVRGVEWLQQLFAHDCHALLADEMGLGKTLQVLSLVLRGAPMEGSPSIVVCPASVVPVWRREVEKFFPGTRLEILGRGCRFADHPETRLWVASYSQLRRHKEELDATEFGYAILDEAQFIKNPDAKITQACLALRARRRLALTGTPIENRLLDLWTLFRFLLPGLLGSRRRLEEGLANERIDYTARVRRLVQPFVLRRTKSEVGTELPPKVEVELPCELTPLQRREYLRLVDEGTREYQGSLAENVRSERSLGVLSLLTRLRQACCDPALLPGVQAPWDQSGKLASLVARLENVVASGRKAVVFSQFTSFLDRAREALQATFPGLALEELTGSTVDREAPVQRFQTGEGAAVMLVSLRAGGTGITLHAADYVFLLDPWWNPAVEAQAIDRVHRIGQEKRVFVYRLVTRGTIEERIELLKQEKRALFDAVLEGVGAPVDLLTHFPHLEDLIRLTDQAEGDEG